ncbi:hypothetical protein TrVE_jg7167 [Triparma verrucosa]|uniref:Uncharacterized protein n=1 Tax=Triparma verrucosa TaxID=1606542 RepID=A0A9W7C2R0_9STRA|nr:hypothetical protein TrVE_jg7167 [Triparma verrucosa]
MSSFPLGTDVYVLSNNSEHAAKIVGPVTGPATGPATSLQTIRVKWTVRGGEDDVDIKRVKRMWDEFGGRPKRNRGGTSTSTSTTATTGSRNEGTNSGKKKRKKEAPTKDAKSEQTSLGKKKVMPSALQVKTAQDNKKKTRSPFAMYNVSGGDEEDINECFSFLRNLPEGEKVKKKKTKTMATKKVLWMGPKLKIKVAEVKVLKDVVEEDDETLVDELDLNASQESQGCQGSFYDFKGNKFEKKELSDAIPSPLELVRKSSRVSLNESSTSADSVFVSSKALHSLLGDSSSEGSDREEDDTLPPNPNSRTLNLPSRSLRLSPKRPVKPSRYSSFVGRGMLGSPIAAVAKTNKAIRDMNPSPERVGIAPLILPRMREGEDQI